MEIDHDATLKVLNEIVELELAGVVRYTQYSLMIFGHARIPIMNWMREQALESLGHATQAGEEVTTLGGDVSLGIGELVSTRPASVAPGGRCVPQAPGADRGAQCVAGGVRTPDDPH